MWGGWGWGGGRGACLAGHAWPVLCRWLLVALGAGVRAHMHMPARGLAARVWFNNNICSVTFVTATFPLQFSVSFLVSL